MRLPVLLLASFWKLGTSFVIVTFFHPRLPLRAADDDAGTPGNVADMRVGEIKAELDARGISYAGFFEKEELVSRLEKARASGEASPDIVDKFTRTRLEERMGTAEPMPSFSKEEMDAVTAGDGTLPGGLKPEQLQKMMENPEIMVLLQSPKVQAVMKAVMEKGPAAMEDFKDDPEALASLQQLTEAMGTLP
ncbi:unnamed protein product [Chrysoparadoxa australica]